MKYHYQYVSKTTVRIELIPEDKKEALQIGSIKTGEHNHPELLSFYQQGLHHYSPDTELTRINFMNFPKVALCSFARVIQALEKAG